MDVARQIGPLHRSQSRPQSPAAAAEGVLLRLVWQARVHASTMTRLVFVLLLAGGLVWLAPFRWSSPTSQTPPQASDQPVAVAAPAPPPEVSDAPPDTAKFPPIDFEALRLRFGNADAQTTTAWDNPRPPLVTRTMTFNRHRLKVVMIADAPAGAPPPYKRWLLTGLLDPLTNEPLSADEIEKRLSATPTSERATQGARPPSTQATR
jgi:hypothetical protein